MLLGCKVNSNWLSSSSYWKVKRVRVFTFYVYAPYNVFFYWLIFKLSLLNFKSLLSIFLIPYISKGDRLVMLLLYSKCVLIFKSGNYFNFSISQIFAKSYSDILRLSECLSLVGVKRWENSDLLNSLNEPTLWFPTSVSLRSLASKLLDWLILVYS